MAPAKAPATQPKRAPKKTAISDVSEKCRPASHPATQSPNQMPKNEPTARTCFTLLVYPSGAFASVPFCSASLLGTARPGRPPCRRGFRRVKFEAGSCEARVRPLLNQATGYKLAEHVLRNIVWCIRAPASASPPSRQSIVPATPSESPLALYFALEQRRAPGIEIANFHLNLPSSDRQGASAGPSGAGCAST
jgi:hypothetical protein